MQGEAYERPECGPKKSSTELWPGLLAGSARCGKVQIGDVGQTSSADLCGRVYDREGVVTKSNWLDVRYMEMQVCIRSESCKMLIFGKAAMLGEGGG